MDAARSGGGRRPGGVPPFVGFLAFVGVLTLGIGALLAASKDVRENVGRMLAPTPNPSPVSGGADDGSVAGNIIRIKDYTKLKYNPPVPFGSTTFAARGDLLAYSPKAGIFFVKDSSGQMAYMSRKGEVLAPITAFDVQTPPPTPVPTSRVFYTADLQGNTYISYPAQKAIVKYDRNGKKLRTIKSVERPEALTVDEDGNLYVIYDSEIKKLEAVPIGAGEASPNPKATPKVSASASP